jgi:hypothetical protein
MNLQIHSFLQVESEAECSSISVDDVNLRRSTIMTRARLIPIITIIVAAAAATIITFFAWTIIFPFSATVLFSLRGGFWNFNAFTAHFSTYHLNKH